MKSFELVDVCIQRPRLHIQLGDQRRNVPLRCRLGEVHGYTNILSCPSWLIRGSPSAALSGRPSVFLESATLFAAFQVEVDNIGQAHERDEVSAGLFYAADYHGYLAINVFVIFSMVTHRLTMFLLLSEQWHPMPHHAILSLKYLNVWSPNTYMFQGILKLCVFGRHSLHDNIRSMCSRSNSYLFKCSGVG